MSCTERLRGHPQMADNMRAATLACRNRSASHGHGTSTSHQIQTAECVEGSTDGIESAGEGERGRERDRDRDRDRETEALRI